MFDAPEPTPTDAGPRVDCGASYRAAWVPFDDPARPWDPTTAATRWLVQQARQLNLRLRLVTNRPLAGSLPPALQYVNECERQTKSWTGARQAVLAYLPSSATAARAFRLAYRGAVVVVEGPQLPLTGWAAEVGALNLLTGRGQPELSSDVTACLQALLHLLDTDEVSSPQTDAVVADLRDMGTRLPTGYLAGCLLAHGSGPKTVRRALELERRAFSAGS